MTVNKAEIITNSIMNDLGIQVNTIINDFYNSDEFKEKVEEIRERREEIQALVNKMDNLIPDKYKKSNDLENPTASISLFDYTFYYSEEDDYWNMCDLTISCENEAKCKFKLHNYTKISYIRNKVFAIICTLDELDYPTIKQIIDSSINIKDILFNNDI